MTAKGLKLTRWEDGRVEILDAPESILVALESLRGCDVPVKAEGQRLTYGGQVVYAVVCWDESAQALVAKKIEDRRRRV